VVIDRGADRGELPDEVVPRDKKKRFIIRLRKDRHPRSGEIKAPMWLVAVEGCGQEQSVRWVASASLSRWRVEEASRFVRQVHDLEDVRVRTCERLRTMTVLVAAAVYFTAVVLGARTKLHILAARAIAAATRFIGVPDFRYCAIADGIRGLLLCHPRPGLPPPRAPSAQQSLVPL
jgi:hypothetical protein